MTSTEKAPRELPCPNPRCRREIKTSFYEILSRREVRCSCGSSYKFTDSSSLSQMRRALQNHERAQEEFRETYQELISGADKLIKG